LVWVTVVALQILLYNKYCNEHKAHVVFGLLSMKHFSKQEPQTEISDHFW